MQKNRCSWVTENKLYLDYHDKEWGVPIYNSKKLFEFLILEGAQAGLSWEIILKKRANYRQCFDNFSPQKIANYDAKKLKELLQNPGIIRNRLKVAAAVTNAQAYLKVAEEWGNFSKYIWHFVEGKPILNYPKTSKAIPTRTELSDKISQDLKKRGFKFVGTTICYAFMQAVGMVNDHTQNCFRSLHSHLKP